MASEEPIDVTAMLTEAFILANKRVHTLSNGYPEQIAALTALGTVGTALIASITEDRLQRESTAAQSQKPQISRDPNPPRH
jgi:hypothetical protein